MPPYLHHSRVNFHETDAAGIVHFSNYLRYAEEAEVLALHHCGYLTGALKEGLALPRIKVQVEYFSPLRFWEEYQTTCTLLYLGESSMRWGFQIHAHGQLCAQIEYSSARRSPQGGKAAFTPHERELLQTLMAV